MVIQLQVPEDVSRRFDELAEYAGQSREQVMLDALRDVLRKENYVPVLFDFARPAPTTSRRPFACWRTSCGSSWWI